jgi:hypothetical protein
MDMAPYVEMKRLLDTNNSHISVLLMMGFELVDQQTCDIINSNNHTINSFDFEELTCINGVCALIDVHDDGAISTNTVQRWLHSARIECDGVLNLSPAAQLHRFCCPIEGTDVMFMVASNKKSLEDALVDVKERVIVAVEEMRIINSHN